MERNDSAVAERPTGTPKPFLMAMVLASGRILISPIRHGFKPLRIDYRTGDVWPDNESAVE